MKGAHRYGRMIEALAKLTEFFKCLDLEENNMKPEKRGKLALFFIHFGKLVLDATKLSFASLVLGTIIKGDIPPSTLLTAGIIVTGVGAIFGITLITILEEK